ncbi:peptidylprolyl isomerase [Lichenibacterium minor]|uniref:Parvulin-like PPIase n=1 Tax=Lichenibacterium minor TaxID=2316528 RepID=A0A4Q2U595_9HYPH|nr:peptidylprolyl isomerase [Lichenibacterium minor]RYC31743.1 peptidylprolyl isomerase [Lichenibacterium minor]
MLGGIRAAQSTWIGKALTTLIFGVILIAFVIWGIGDPFRGGSANAVAQVGDVTITTAAYRQAYQADLQDIQRRTRRAVTNEEAHRIGLDARVLSRLMSNAALDDRAQSFGLAISDRQIAKGILSDPSFAGPGGAFDRARFNEVLRDNNFTEASFIREQRGTYLRQELVGALIGGIEAPTAAIDALHRYEDETRSLDAIALPASAAGPAPVPDDAAARAYYDGHKAAFTAPQYRKLVVLAVTPATVAKPDDVSEADAQALYEKDKAARFSTPEKRHVSQVVFPTEDAAAAFVRRVRAGEPFADAVKADGLGDKLVDLGTVAKEAIFDRAVADAAFGLPAMGITDPVKGTFGTVVAQVDAVEPGATQPFAAVAPDLKREIAGRRAGAALTALHDRIEDARASGKTLAEAAAAAGLQVRTIDTIDAQGKGRDGAPVAGLVDGPDLLKAAFASDIGVDNDTLSTPDGGTVWFEVAGIDPARPLTFDEAKAKVQAVWTEEETSRRLDAKAAELVRDIDAGTQTMEGVAASLGLAVEHVADAKRAGAAGLPPGVVAKAFDVPVGSAGSAATGPTGRTLFKVIDSVTPPLDPDAENIKRIAQRYGAALQDAVINDYLGTLGAKLGTKVNQAAVQQASSGAGY